MFGFLNINKPAGITSRDVVNRVIGTLRERRAGHAGTLDPLATGVLLVAIGPATRLVDHLHTFSKTYLGTFHLGVTSSTEDTEGEVVPVVNAPIITREQIEPVLAEFTGEIEQQPPAFSALRVDGKRAYKLARKGKQVDLKSRPVIVQAIRLTRFNFPDFELEIECGTGTYIRSIGRDLGLALGSGAVMTSLQRTAIGPFNVKSAMTISADMSPGFVRNDIAILNPLLSFDNAVKVPVTETDIDGLIDGQFLKLPAGVAEREPIIAVQDLHDGSERLIALMQPYLGMLKPKINFARHWRGL